MKTKEITVLMVAIFLVNILAIKFNIVRVPPMAASGNLLVNGGFENGLNGWNLTAPPGSYSYNVTSDGVDHPHALDYRRWNSGDVGSTCGAGQELDILVQFYRELYVELDVKVVNNTLHNSGWWSDEYGGSGEWPATVRITYEDVNGTEWTWEHGFFPDDDNEFYGRTNFEYVIRNQWHQYISPNLVNVITTKTAPHNEPIESPTPYRLKRIFVGGTGWDVGGLLDNVVLWGIPRYQPLPSTIYVDPPEVTAPVSENLKVSVNIENVTDLFAWQIKLKWNPQILDFVDTTEGNFLKTGGLTAWGYDVDEAEGWIFIDSYSDASVVPFPGVSGNGTLSNITFHGADLGECNLELYHTWLIAATPAPAPGETYGDVDGDLIVSMLDAAAIAMSWGTSEGDFGYNPDADFNSDGFIDLFDLTYVLLNSGKRYPDDDASKPVEISHDVSDGHVTVTLPVHNIDTGLDYATIQAAIDAPETLDSHTILVDAGTYYENVVVDKSLSLIGQDISTTIIDGSLTGNVINIVTNNVNITSFTIQNSGFDPTIIYSGINLGEGTRGNNISYNIVTNNTYGISLFQSSGNWVSGNNVTANSEYGIMLFYLSTHNSISGNNISNDWCSIYVFQSSNNNVSGNAVTASNVHAIYLDRSSNNSISGNAVTVSGDYGIFLRAGSSNNSISGNSMSNNSRGIKLKGSSNNFIYHNNFINNTIQADAEREYLNIWDDGCEGNYWSDHAGVDVYSGKYQNETGSDGIGDTPYIIDEDNQDNYPLMFRWWSYADIHSDSEVNILDIATCATAFGSYAGHERWYCRADINRDQQVNIEDISAVAWEFGKHYY